MGFRRQKSVLQFTQQMEMERTSTSKKTALCASNTAQTMRIAHKRGKIRRQDILILGLDLRCGNQVTISSRSLDLGQYCVGKA